MHIVCSDLEGVFVPEIWINVAEKTGIEELRLTTRDIADYNELMQKRLSILDQHKIKLGDITRVIDEMEPLPGAVDFLNWLRERSQVIIVSDTYVQFAGPLMRQLGWPTLFCHTLLVAPDGTISDYRLRQEDGKRKSVEAMQGLNFHVIAMGDSYNDISMLKAADEGILFRPPENVVSEFPQFPVAREYEDLKPLIEQVMAGEAG
ncbi:MAG: bifunctional phosphoserine phosphatase/homoserine phosphotransferase ThrH [Thermodesulfobacteriota bacterium]